MGTNQAKNVLGSSIVSAFLSDMLVSVFVGSFVRPLEARQALGVVFACTACHTIVSNRQRLARKQVNKEMTGVLFARILRGSEGRCRSVTIVALRRSCAGLTNLIFNLSLWDSRIGSVSAGDIDLST